MPYTKYHTISKERYEILDERYAEFMELVDQPDTTPVRVFDDLSPKLVEELNMIRELSVQLQKKKEEDMMKAAQAQAEAEAQAKKEAEAAAKADREASNAVKENKEAEAQN